MKKLMNVVEKVSIISAFISGIFMILVMLLVVVNIITRRFFEIPIYGATELVRYGMMVAASFALLNNEWHDGNVQMTVIVESLPGKAKAALNTVINFIGFIGIIYVAYFMAMQVFYKFSTGELTSDLLIPVWIFVAVLTIGSVLLALCLLVKSVLCGYTFLTGKQAEIMHSLMDGGA